MGAADGGVVGANKPYSSFEERSPAYFHNAQGAKSGIVCRGGRKWGLEIFAGRPPGERAGVAGPGQRPFASRLRAAAEDDSGPLEEVRAEWRRGGDCLEKGVERHFGSDQRRRTTRSAVCGGLQRIAVNHKPIKDM